MKIKGIDMERCHLYSSIEDVEREYLNSSIFVLSSRYEGFGLVLVEAMACGLPVISFDCPCGPKDIIADGKEGLLIESGNVTAMAHGLMTLINDADMRRSMSEAARKNALRFNFIQIASEWTCLFESLSQ